MRHNLRILLMSLLAIPFPALAHPSASDLAWDDDVLLASSVQFDSQVSIQIRGDYRYIDANGIPNHDTGDFPNHGNPNSISPQRYHLRVPANPTYTEKSTANRFPNLIGIALNGVPFDPATNEWYRNDRATGWNVEAINNTVTPVKKNLGIDLANAHVQPTGAYHYHSIPWPLLTQISGKDFKSKMTLLGYAADGFPIYGPYAYTNPSDPKSAIKMMRPSYKLKEGSRPAGKDNPPGKYDGTYTRDWTYVAGSGDLDESNGRTGVTAEYPNGTYYYVLTDGFPYIPRSFHGTPDPSFQRGPRGSGGPGGGPGNRPRPPRDPQS